MTHGWLLVAAATGTLVLPAPAAARWSEPQSIRTPDVWTSDVAVNARGDAATAWTTSVSSVGPQAYRTSVHVAIRQADGRLTVRRVWLSDHHRAGGGLSVGIDRRGEVSLAWTAGTRRQAGHGTDVWTAHGPARGRWAAARRLGHGYGGRPRLAVAPDGQVLLAWFRGGTGISGIDVAWRGPGRSFTRPRPLGPSHSSLARGPVPAFDAGGTAYITGGCQPIVLRAAPLSRRFGAPARLANGTAVGFTLSVSQAGRGLASWARGRCVEGESETGDIRGPVFASLLTAGRFGAPISAGPEDETAVDTIALARPGGGGTVRWSGGAGCFSADISDHGIVGPLQTIADGVAPTAVDGGGDIVFVGPVFSCPGVERAQPGTIYVRPASGGPDERAPTASGVVAVAAPVGRAAAVVWQPTGRLATGRLALSVWRP